MTTPGSTRTENDAIVDALSEAWIPDTLKPGHIYGYKLRDRVEKIDLSDIHLERPRRKKGTFAVTDAASFGIYYRKHSDTGSEVWADLDRSTIIAVLNAHETTLIDEIPGEEGGEVRRVFDADATARFGDHRLTLTLAKTKAWKAWMAGNEHDFGQIEFAEFLEDHLPDVAEPPGADMLELVTKFHATSEASYSSAIVLQNGDRQLTYTDVTNARGGGGTIEIPRTFKLYLRPYEDSEPVTISARFRYRVRGGKLTLGYILDEPDEILRQAFGQVSATIAAELNTDVMNGTPTS
ncbi:DUF2303 family protein [Streptosporangiaceae bacterium NEAU-GS5]|nr:DUF2303 family protein [Streptosporangiaceae bacterium NEAU-GS5]